MSSNCFDVLGARIRERELDVGVIHLVLDVPDEGCPLKTVFFTNLHKSTISITCVFDADRRPILLLVVLQDTNLHLSCSEFDEFEFVR